MSDVRVRGNSRKKLLLCIDDHAEVLELLREFLEVSGFSVLTAINGRRGLKALENNPVDAVLVDYDMPGMKGDAVAAQIQKTQPNVPILIFSGYAADLPARIHSVADGVFMKGEKATELLAAIRRLFRAPRKKLAVRASREAVRRRRAS